LSAAEALIPLLAVRRFAPVVHRRAALLGGGVGVALFHLLLDLVAGVAARGRSGNRGEHLAAAAADLVAEKPAHHGTDSGAEQAIFILHRLGMGHLLIVAVLPRCAHC